MYEMTAMGGRAGTSEHVVPSATSAVIAPYRRHLRCQSVRRARLLVGAERRTISDATTKNLAEIGLFARRPTSVQADLGSAQHGVTSSAGGSRSGSG